MKLFLLLCLCLAPWFASAEEKIYQSEGQKFRFETLIERDDLIWGFDFLAPDRIVFSERGGKLNTFQIGSKAVTLLKGAPAVFAEGQGGMLDVRVHPKKKDRIFFTYSEPVGDKATTALGSATVVGPELKEVKKVISLHEPNSNEIHFGSRIEFDREGFLFISMGDRNDRAKALDLGFHQGKILRIDEEGRAAPGNPFAARAGAKAEIWSYGHRNPQGLAVHPETGVLWETEMGPRGGDEFNRVHKGANYGWPEVTYGREYYGPKIGVPEKAGVEPPAAYWVPSISPSGLAFYSGKAFPKWKSNAFLANLSSTHLRRLVLDGEKVVRQEELLKELGERFRHVRSGPDGYLYVSTDSGKIARLVPVP